MAECIGHKACDKCGSSDNVAVYDDGSEYCFTPGCTHFVPSPSDPDQKKSKPKLRLKTKVGEKLDKKKEREVKMTKILSEEDKTYIKEVGGFRANGFRGIKDEILKFYGVRTAVAEDGEVLTRYYPTTIQGELSGYKIRDIPKSFSSVGEVGKTCDMFGAFRFQNGGKYVLVVGGEEDTLAAYQMFKDYADSKNSEFVTAVVSATCGEGSWRQFANNYEFFNSFDNIILGLDADEAGEAGIEKAVSSLPKGKVKIVNWTGGKDPNAILMAGKQNTFIRDFYNAKPYLPAGVLPSSGLMDKIIEAALIQKVPLPPFMKKANAMIGGGIALGHIVNIAAQTSIGKCHGKGTKIRMYDLSLKNVEDVKNGDLIMGQDGTPRTVTGVTSGIDNLYRVDQKRGISYTVNSSHILSLRANADKKLYSIKKGDIHNVNIEEYLKYPKGVKHILKGYKAEMSKFGDTNNDISDVDFAWLFGLWLAEGTSRKAQFTIANKDSEIKDELFRICNNLGYVIKTPNQTSTGCTTYDISGGLYSILHNMQVIGNKHIPLNYMNSNREIRLAVLAGFIDGDGYLSKSNSYDLTLKNNSLASDILLLCQTLGLYVSEKDEFKNCQNFGGDVYKRIVIGGNLHLIPNRLSRKKVHGLPHRNSLNTGITITPIGKGEYYGFQLDGDHLYCLEDFTVTHNTAIVNEMIYHWIFNSPHLVGVVSMELNSGQYGETLLSRHIQRKIAKIETVSEKLDFLNSEFAQRKAKELFTKENGEPRFYLVDDRDGTVEQVQEVIEQMIIASGVKIIVIDPLQDLIEGMSNEEQALFMKWCKSVIKSHNVTFILINHMRKKQSSDDSIKVSESDIMGSSTIAKSATINILLARDKEAEDPIERNTTYITIPKSRITGDTGNGGKIYYVNETHTMHDFDEYFSSGSVKVYNRPDVKSEPTKPEPQISKDEVESHVESIKPQEDPWNLPSGTHQIDPDPFGDMTEGQGTTSTKESNQEAPMASNDDLPPVNF